MIANKWYLRDCKWIVLDSLQCLKLKRSRLSLPFLPFRFIMKWLLINKCLFNNSACFVDPCSGMSCGVNSRASCTLTKTKMARCVCIPDCKDAFRGQVCSTDQRTYSNECALRTDSCQNKRKVEVDYYSKCKSKLKKFISKTLQI